MPSATNVSPARPKVETNTQRYSIFPKTSSRTSVATSGSLPELSPSPPLPETSPSPPVEAEIRGHHGSRDSSIAVPQIQTQDPQEQEQSSVAHPVSSTVLPLLSSTQPAAPLPLPPDNGTVVPSQLSHFAPLTPRQFVSHDGGDLAELRESLEREIEGRFSSKTFPFGRTKNGDRSSPHQPPPSS